MIVDPKLGPYGDDYEDFCKECFGEAMKVIKPKFTQYTYTCAVCGNRAEREYDCIVTSIQCGNCGGACRLDNL